MEPNRHGYLTNEVDCDEPFHVPSKRGTGYRRIRKPLTCMGVITAIFAAGLVIVSSFQSGPPKAEVLPARWEPSREAQLEWANLRLQAEKFRAEAQAANARAALLDQQADVKLNEMRARTPKPARYEPRLDDKGNLVFMLVEEPPTERPKK